ncbi:uncharacterized protein LOC142550893 isoform X2 [Primulina tabacum]|uniref:uncharacterized protein LOC142550893 isoform X2 n=1 Tax=Primulina tabacum TaxID=48773 RepID=UPI003F5A535F
MQTKFIAVQCFQCSTMQVKQAKKSSNKWVCVVCNQKQSVLRVFAEGLMAKDIRQFVQKFNMSRQLSDRKESALEEVEDIFEEEGFSVMEDQKKKRSDWTEYVEYDQDEGSERFEKYERAKDYGGDTFDEAMVVTEMPKPVLKKPKLKDYAAGIGRGKNLLKSVFPNRSKDKRPKNARYQDMQQMRSICSDEEEQIELHRENMASKQNSFMTQILDDDNDLAERTDVSTSKQSEYITLSENENTSNGQLNHKIAANGPVSKWSSYITKEDDTDFSD